LQEARADPFRKARMRALEWRSAIDEAKGKVVTFEDGNHEDLSALLKSEALDEIKETAGAIGEDEAVRLARMLKSATPPASF
jgi:thiazole synthase ThiGH ThiG subunit